MSKININDYVVFSAGGIENNQSNGNHTYWERGDLAQVIDIDENNNYWFADGSWTPDLRGFVGVYGFKDLSKALEFKANGYSLRPETPKMTTPKPRALSCDQALEACKARFAVGMEILNMRGCRFILKSMNFRVKDSGEVLTNCTELVSNYTLYCPEKDEFAKIISNPITEESVLIDTAKRTFVFGLKYITKYGDYFISSSEDTYSFQSGNIKLHKNRDDHGLTVYTPQCGWAKECNFNRKKQVRSHLEEALKRIEDTFKRGMSVKTFYGEEFDLDGDFEYVIDEDSETIDLIDEDGAAFTFYCFDDKIYPTIIETSKPLPSFSCGFGAEKTAYVTATKSSDILDDLLEMLEVKSLISK